MHESRCIKMVRYLFNYSDLVLQFCTISKLEGSISDNVMIEIKRESIYHLSKRISIFDPVVI